jgi:hypothetical protein
MKTQLCLLSGELMPNVIGILYDQPQRVIPVITQQSAYQLRHLENALRTAGCAAIIEEAVTVLPYDLADCLSSIGKAAALASGPTINWTGGTKIMSFAARHVAQSAASRAMYVNTADLQLLVEEVAGQSVVQSELLDSARLGLNTLVHIEAAGHSVERGGSLEEFRTAHTPAPELCAAAEAILEAQGREWSDLFRLAAAADKPYTPKLLSPRLLRALQAAKIIQPSPASGAFFLHAETLGRPFHRNSPQQENAKFIQGGYLEVFLWSQLKQRGAFDDVAWHVTLNPGQRGRVSEIDVVVASGGRLLTIESKGRIELADLADLIEEEYARSRRVGRLFGRWAIYIHQFKDEFWSQGAAAIIASQEARAGDYGGRIFWHDDLVDFPVLIGGYLNEVQSRL